MCESSFDARLVLCLRQPLALGLGLLLQSNLTVETMLVKASQLEKHRDAVEQSGKAILVCVASNEVLKEVRRVQVLPAGAVLPWYLAFRSHRAPTLFGLSTV